MTIDSEYDTETRNTSIKNVLRWIALIPSALVGFVVGRLFFLFAMGISLSYVGAAPDSLLVQVSQRYFGGLGAGMGLILATIYVAPCHRKHVAIVAFAFVLVLAGFLLFPVIYEGDYWAILEIVFMGIGAGGMVSLVFDKDSQFEVR